jgi:branched-chain amino acid transport system substrate-binding protein
MLKYKDDPFHKQFLELIGTDAVDAREDGSKRVNAKSHSWQSYENIFALKQAIEASGWKTKKDDQGVIEALEGAEFGNSLAHPQGTKLLRKEDHSGMINCYISRIENNEFQVKKEVSREEMQALLAPRHDLSAMAI